MFRKPAAATSGRGVPFSTAPSRLPPRQSDDPPQGCRSSCFSDHLPLAGPTPKRAPVTSTSHVAFPGVWGRYSGCYPLRSVQSSRGPTAVCSTQQHRGGGNVGNPKTHVMGFPDELYERDYRRCRLALRMIKLEARTSTICL